MIAAQSMAVDPITGNVYFSAENSGYIYVMNENGKHLKTLMQPTEPRMKYTIRKMQVDYVNRLVLLHHHNYYAKSKYIFIN